MHLLPANKKITSRRRVVLGAVFGASMLALVASATAAMAADASTPTTAPSTTTQGSTAATVTDPKVLQAQLDRLNAAMGNTPTNANAATNGQTGAPSTPYSGIGSFFKSEPEKKGMTKSEYEMGLLDHDSPQYKAELLAKQAKQRDDLIKTFDPNKIDDPALKGLPQSIDALQYVHEANGSNLGDEVNIVKDDNVKGNFAFDMRRDAQRAAALSYGARGGLAKRNFEIMEHVNGYEAVLDRVFSFRSLLVKAPSGLLIEPPIVRESLDALVVTGGGNEAAVADQVLKISKEAKIVTAPRDWRQYLIQTWTSIVPPPPRVLWPKNKIEQDRWNDWIKLGWAQGMAQADEMFDTNLNRLSADYAGMVRYRMLLTQGMISQPYALQEDRGVTGSKTEMRVGDRALRITGPSQFMMGSDLWKPADR